MGSEMCIRDRDIISQMKGMVTDNPAQVMQLFSVAPQLAYAIFQALLLLGLTDTTVLGSIVQGAANPQNAQYSQPQPPPVQAPQPPPTQYAPAPAFAGYPNQSHAPTPPVQQTPYPPPPQVAQPDSNALIQQVLAMTRQQILALPAQERDQLVQIRAQLGHPV